MASYASKYLQDAQVNWLRGVTFPAALTGGVYVALITTAPTDRTGTGLVEATGGSYARQQISNANLPAPTTSGTGTTAIEQSSNAAQLSYTNMPSCTLVGVAFYDAVTAGQFLGYADMTGGAQVIAAGATFNLPASNVTIQSL